MRPGVLRSELDWEIYPDGLYRTLMWLRREHLPIFVTENGIADASDALRPQFLIDHARAMLSAIGDGVPLRGYFHWTCFDNFEWAEGYSAKFGLIANDPVRQERRLRTSAHLYAEICRTGVIPFSAEPPPAPGPGSTSSRPADRR